LYNVGDGEREHILAGLYLYGYGWHCTVPFTPRTCCDEFGSNPNSGSNFM